MLEVSCIWRFHLIAVEVDELETHKLHLQPFVSSTLQMLVAFKVSHSKYTRVLKTSENMKRNIFPIMSNALQGSHKLLAN